MRYVIVIVGAGSGHLFAEGHAEGEFIHIDFFCSRTAPDSNGVVKPVWGEPIAMDILPMVYPRNEEKICGATTYAIEEYDPKVIYTTVA